MLRPTLLSRFTSWQLVLLVAVLAMLAAYCYATAPGLGGTGDSRYYLFAAQSWRQHGQLLDPDGTPFRFWPPLFPLLLSWAGTVSRLRALHGMCLVGSLLLWSAVGRQLLPPRRALAVPLLLAFSALALVLSKFVWAETIFGLLWAGYVWALLRWRRTAGLAAFSLSVALGFLMLLQRTPGVFLLVGVGVTLLAERPTFGQPRRPARVLHLLLTLAGTLLWHWHIRLLPGPNGPYFNRGWSQLFSSLADYGFVLSRWLLPLPAGWREAVPQVVWIAGLLSLLFTLWPRPTPGSAATACQKPVAVGLPQPAFDKQWQAVFPLRLLWASLLAGVVLLLPPTILNRCGNGVHDAERYLSALYPVVVLLTLHNWPTPAQVPAGLLAPFFWRRLSQALLLAWVFYAGLRTLHNAGQLRQVPVTTLLPHQIGLPSAPAQRLPAM